MLCFELKHPRKTVGVSKCDDCFSCHDSVVHPYLHRAISLHRYESVIFRRLLLIIRNQFLCIVFLKYH